MKLTEAQKQRRIKARLSYQKHCKHLEIEWLGSSINHMVKVWKCTACLKEFDDEWHGNKLNKET